MTFKKDQRVRGKASDREYRVESGPYPAVRGGGVVGYLVERISDGVYSFQATTGLVPAPPRQGDMGYIIEQRPGGSSRHPYSPHRLVYIDNKVILVEDRLGDYETFTGPDRARVLENWEPVDD